MSAFISPQKGNTDAPTSKCLQYTVKPTKKSQPIVIYKNKKEQAE
jgi:hypothetical protein